MQQVYKVFNALFNALTNIANALQNTAIENNYSALESFPNRLKYLAKHFQRIFHAFSMHFRLIFYAGFSQKRVTYLHELFFKARKSYNSQRVDFNITLLRFKDCHS